MASAKPTPWVVITRSAAVPPAPQAWQRQRSGPWDGTNMLTGGVRPVWGPCPASGQGQVAERPRPRRGPSTSSANAPRSVRARTSSRS
jgi:hypothetical protein